MVEFSRCGGAAQQPQRTEPSQCVSGQPWLCHGALQGQMQPLQRAEGMVELALGALAGLARWLVVGVAVLPIWGGLFLEEEAALGNHSAQNPASV